jgi:hypothetical protein
MPSTSCDHRCAKLSSIVGLLTSSNPNKQTKTKIRDEGEVDVVVEIFVIIKFFGRDRGTGPWKSRFWRFAPPGPVPTHIPAQNVAARRL